MKKSWYTTVVCFFALTVWGAGLAAAKPNDAKPVELTAAGKKLESQYAATLQSLSDEIEEAAPSVDPGLRLPWLRTFHAESTQKPYIESNLAYTNAVNRCQEAAAPILDMVKDYLSSDKLDDKLIKASIIAEATPAGLAAFAQKSAANKALIDKLLSDPALMKQIQIAGGARNGNYGLTMQIYTAIEHASKQADKGILQRLALGTALFQHPYHKPMDKDQPAYDPVKRYLLYQKAYLKGELDPSFPIFTTWECRFIANDPFSDADLNWCRKMLENYEPEHIFTANYKWRYALLVRSDVSYNHPMWGIVPASKAQQAVAGGGECGPRAWIGRLATRAFGIPTWGERQKGHAAMSHWTPQGWVICLGASWSWAYWDGQSGLNFHLESQARRYPKQFMKVLRARWTGAVLGDDKPDGMVPGTGGFWYAMATTQERAIVASGKPTRVIPTNQELARKYGPTLAQKVMDAPVTAAEKQVTVDKNGVIHIPAVACREPSRSTTRILLTRSFLGGMQLHYNRVGIVHTHLDADQYERKGDGVMSQSRPVVKDIEPFVYSFKSPHGGKYMLTARVVTVSPKQHLLLTANSDTKRIDIAVPWTDGMWQTTKPVEVTLVKGLNLLRFTRNTTFLRGLTIKDFTLTPAK